MVYDEFDEPGVIRTHFAHAQTTYKSKATANGDAIQNLASVISASPHILRSGSTVENLRSGLDHNSEGQYAEDAEACVRTLPDTPGSTNKDSPFPNCRYGRPPRVVALSIKSLYCIALGDFTHQLLEVGAG